MKINELSKKLKDSGFSKVYVSGPQRSGTTITSKILSRDLQFKQFQELRTLEQANDLKENVVAQCPQIVSCLHEITTPNSVVIFMCRSLKDIIASGDRINWNGTHQVGELIKYEEKFPDYFVRGYHLSAMVQNVWLSHQMPLMKIPFFNFTYDGIKNDSWYVPKIYRKNFNDKQTFKKNH
jgi:hypothetical protein